MSLRNYFLILKNHLWTMREALFIKKNAQKWQEYEHFQTDDPDEMAGRFTTLVDDLAYAKLTASSCIIIREFIFSSAP